MCASIFFFVYLLPITVFGAEIEVSENGLTVTQYRSTTVAYSEVSSCRRFFLIPFHIVVVTTTRKFPLNLLIALNSGGEKRRSPTRDGDLAALIKSRIDRLNLSDNRG